MSQTGELDNEPNEPAPPSADESKKKKTVWKSLSLWQTWLFGSAILGIFAIGTFFGDRYQPVSGPISFETAGHAPQTESAFLAQNRFGDADVLAEWRDVRGDHKMIAYAIAYCKKFRDAYGNIDTIPRHVFSALLLDLTPIGEHHFTRQGMLASDASIDPGALSEVAAKAVALPAPPTGPLESSSSAPVELSSYEQRMLFLSDAIGRARLMAAQEASSNYPNMRTFGWVTVFISALATLFVTVKASMTPPKPENVATLRWLYFGVGIAAVVLSTAGTTLTSVKQFYDPTRAYRTSKAALIELQRLHKEIGLDFISNWDSDQCGDIRSASSPPKISDWGKRLASLQGDIIKAASNLQESDLSQLTLNQNSGRDGSVQRTSITSPPEGAGR